MADPGDATSPPNVGSDPTAPVPDPPAYTPPPPTAPPAYLPPPAYAPPPPYPGATAPLPVVTGPGAPGRPGGRDRRRLLIAAGTGGVVVLALLAYFLFSSGSSGARTPADAVRRLLDAGRTNDVNKATSVLCSSDRALGELTHLQSSGTITSYTIGAQSVEAGVTIVQASLTTSQNPAPQTEQFPVIKENGSWKVCFTSALAQLPGGLPSGLPSNLLPSGLPSSILSGVPTGATSAGHPGAVPGLSGLPSGLESIPGLASVCQSADSGFGVASNYVGAAEIGLPQIAQACVYHDAVPASVASELAGKIYTPLTTDANATVIQFRSTDSTRTVTVTTAQESDGHYYVVAATVSG